MSFSPLVDAASGAARVRALLRRPSRAARAQLGRRASLGRELRKGPRDVDKAALSEQERLLLERLGSSDATAAAEEALAARHAALQERERELSQRLAAAEREMAAAAAAEESSGSVGGLQIMIPDGSNVTAEAGRKCPDSARPSVVALARTPGAPGTSLCLNTYMPLQ